MVLILHIRQRTLFRVILQIAMVSQVAEVSIILKHTMILPVMVPKVVLKQT